MRALPREGQLSRCKAKAPLEQAQVKGVRELGSPDKILTVNSKRHRLRERTLRLDERKQRRAVDPRTRAARREDSVGIRTAQVARRGREARARRVGGAQRAGGRAVVAARELLVGGGRAAVRRVHGRARRVGEAQRGGARERQSGGGGKEEESSSVVVVVGGHRRFCV